MDDLPNSSAPEALARWMAYPQDESLFIQRQRTLMLGRIEPMEKEDRSAFGSLFRHLTNFIRRFWQ